MPPLISEESDDFSGTDDQHSTDAAADLSEGEPETSTDAPNDAETQSTSDAAASDETEQSNPHNQTPKSQRLGEHNTSPQLRRSTTDVTSKADPDSETGTQNESTEEEDDDDDDEEEEEDAEGEDDETPPEADEEAESSEESESSGGETDDQGSDTGEEEANAPKSNLCVFCKGTEDARVSLRCASCENFSHQQCTQESLATTDKPDSVTWRCPTCSSAKTESESPKDTLSRARSSAPRLVRDLLPVSRGVQKPNSHSIFAQPLISDGEDGGRALRKRKSLTQEPPSSEKRRRRGTPQAPPTRAIENADDARAKNERHVSHSTRRASQKSMPTARILQHRPFDKPPPHKFIIAFRLEQERIEKILSKPPRPGKRRDRRKPPKIPPPPIFQPPVPKFPALPMNHLIFPSVFTERESELNAKPYGGILSEQESDTSRSLPQFKDREIFEIARKEAEEERRRTSAAAEAEIMGENTAVAKPSRTVSGPPSKIKCIQFGKYVIDTFYAAPYPEEYSHESRLFICEFCLKYLPSEFVAYRHKLKCPAKHPPGDEIYRDGTVSIWEVDGRKKTEYCQCLCLMAKMFLGSKTLYYDVEPFLFYILTEYDELGYHFVGYFSKEKRPASQNNVSCILVMPIHQRKGYATFLIDFSYLLTRIEGKDGSPEKPLSDMGLTAYRSYWDLTISRHLLDMELKPFSTKTLMTMTGMTADDVIHSLERLYAFIRDPVTKTYAVRYDRKLYESIVHDFDSKKHRKLRPGNLVWTPYIMGRSDQAALDGQPLQAIAPREEDMEIDDIVESQATNSAFDKDDMVLDAEAVSPKTQSKTSTTTSRHSEQARSPIKEDPTVVNDYGVVAPGPPSTEALTAALSPEAIRNQSKLNGLVTLNGDGDINRFADSTAASDPLTGYALAYRVHSIPATRFQIDPPIPPAMLRNRPTKKRPHSSAFGRQATNEGSLGSPVPVQPVRSSPRKAASVTGSSVNGQSRGVSPDRNMTDTPVRRSGRKSGLANMEIASLDGTNESESSADHHEVINEVDVKAAEDDEEEEESGSDEEGSAAADDEEEEDEEAEEEVEDDDDDADAEVEEEEESDDTSDDEDAEAEVDVPEDSSSEEADVIDDEEEDDDDED